MTEWVQKSFDKQALARFKADLEAVPPNEQQEAIDGWLLHYQSVGRRVAVSKFHLDHRLNALINERERAERRGAFNVDEIDAKIMEHVKRYGSDSYNS